ncbi:MAG: flavin reductase [bacterium]|nr:flavin reductase [bacterium]MDY4108494.1 flavin reductase [Bacilli bacterium]
MDKKVLRNLSYGVYAVTSRDKDKNVGCIANSIMQVTSNPSVIAVSINHDNYTNKVIKENNKFGVSILKETTDAKIIGTFGYKSSKDNDKFDGINFKEISEIPVLENTCGYMVCKVIDTMETSTHTIFLGEVIEADDYSTENAMTYKYYHENLKGSSPKNAPTYEETSISQVDKDSKKSKWKCSICGYIYEADELPDDFKCPICGAGKEYFELVEG